MSTLKVNSIQPHTTAELSVPDDVDIANTLTVGGATTLESSLNVTGAATLASLALGTDLSITEGGTGASTAAGALTNLGLTATAAELNTLDGITSTVTELNYTDGVTSAIQTQLDAKAPLASPALTGTPTAPTAAEDTNTTQIATTAFVMAQA